jgi:plastocyanin
MNRGVVGSVALLGVVATLMGAGCASTGPERRTVFVDFAHDEAATSFARNFPDLLDARPGDEILFRQAWTGEPHTVTGGRLADDVGRAMEPLLPTLRAGKPVRQSPPMELNEAIERIGEAFVDDDLSSTLAKPCYLRSGEPPKDGSICQQREQPEFDGRFALYNSGVIPYEGPGGNEVRVRLSDDIDPGKYFFYCVVHGPYHFTEVDVKADSDEAESPEKALRRARQEIQRAAAPLLKVYRRAAEGEGFSVDGREVSGPFAGIYTPDVGLAQVSEFVPEHRTVKAGESIRWKVFGGHTVSFNVPRYFPLMEFKDDEVHVNPKIRAAAGSAPSLPPAGGAEPQDRVVDAGMWDGKGFWSSGEIYGDPYAEYSLRISRSGTYRYACLIHPAMVAKLTVTD